MSNSNLATARHVPIAHGRKPRGSEPRIAVEATTSEMRLQAAVVLVEKKQDADDPYADVPCTD
jgi:hypothetical protein